MADLIEVARAAGGDVRPAEELPFALPASPKLAEPPFIAGPRLRRRDAHDRRPARRRARPRARSRTARRSRGCYAAGADAGGIFTGGYGSGLAAALVFGRIAAETAPLTALWAVSGPGPHMSQQDVSLQASGVKV